MYRWLLAVALLVPSVAVARPPCHPSPFRPSVNVDLVYNADVPESPRQATLVNVTVRKITPRLFEARGTGIQLIPTDRDVESELVAVAKSGTKVTLDGRYVAPKVLKVDKVVTNFGIGEVHRPFPVTGDTLPKWAGTDDVLLVFYSLSCPACEQMHQIVNRFALYHTVLAVDVTRNPHLTRSFYVDRYPTFVALRDGQDIGRFTGVVPYASLEKMFDTKAEGLFRHRTKRPLFPVTVIAPVTVNASVPVTAPLTLPPLFPPRP